MLNFEKLPTKATLVIKEGNVINVHTEELIENTDVAIYGNKIIKVGDCSKLIGKETKIINAREKFVIPGIIDSFLILESSMLTPATYGEYALRNGITTLILFPASLFRLFGRSGMDFFEDELINVPIRSYYLIPLVIDESLSAPLISHEVFVEFLLSRKVLGVFGFSKSLNELDVKGVVSQYILDSTLAGKPVGGFSFQDDDFIDSASNLGLSFFSCVQDDRSITKVLRNGRYLVLSVLDSGKLSKIIETIVKSRMPIERVILSTGILDVKELSEKNNLNNLLSYAVKLGVDPIKAVKLSTLNPATLFGIGNILGSISPGRLADIAIMEDLIKFETYATIEDGNIIFLSDEFYIGSKVPRYPENFMDTVGPLENPRLENFQINFNLGSSTNARVIKINEDDVNTEEEVFSLPVHEGKVACDLTRDITYLSLIDRKGKRIQNAFIRGTGLTKGAIASTLNLGSSDIIVVGTNIKDMFAAVQLLAKIRGGISIVENGRNTFSLSLPLAGFMSFEIAKQLSFEIELLFRILSNIGCKNKKLLLTMSTLSDVNIPEIRITKEGLFDVTKGKFVETIIRKT